MEESRMVVVMGIPEEDSSSVEIKIPTGDSILIESYVELSTSRGFDFRVSWRDSVGGFKKSLQ